MSLHPFVVSLHPFVVSLHPFVVSLSNHAPVSYPCSQSGAFGFSILASK